MKIRNTTLKKLIQYHDNTDVPLLSAHLVFEQRLLVGRTDRVRTTAEETEQEVRSVLKISRGTKFWTSVKWPHTSVVL